jgi:hypothetical protein
MDDVQYNFVSGFLPLRTRRFAFSARVEHEFSMGVSHRSLGITISTVFMPAPLALFTIVAPGLKKSIMVVVARVQLSSVSISRLYCLMGDDMNLFEPSIIPLFNFIFEMI